MFDAIFRYMFAGAYIGVAMAEQVMRDGSSEHSIVEDPDNLGYALVGGTVTVPDFVPDNIMSL